MLRIMKQEPTKTPVEILLGLVQGTFSTCINDYVELYATRPQQSIMVSWLCRPISNNSIRRMNRIIKKMQ